ncbi:hypothetical protein DQ04_21211000 [Trypanosoma grayi]|uniref:hypothetical protein n=1 Tax=Trypanosoma grayi TaxID=71804 RepID=UPI0004F4174F|nr:hypothetical protein DQ04_21211000 [Trypanosoma grayi]KEG05503.1 hypothetical protein DQ04_21211000 [Trypanosoma grayi]
MREACGGFHVCFRRAIKAPQVLCVTHPLRACAAPHTQAQGATIWRSSLPSTRPCPQLHMFFYLQLLQPSQPLSQTRKAAPDSPTDNEPRRRKCGLARMQTADTTTSGERVCNREIRRRRDHPSPHRAHQL